MGNTPVQQPTKHENSLEKEWSAGMIPCCVGAENNVGYILLAEQPIYPTSAWQATTETKSDFNRHCGGWNPLWGCADDTDVDMQHTAAREAEEEARMAVGTLSFIRELLLDPRAYSIIFTGCFLAGYGTLTKAERKKIVDYHKKKCLTTPYNKFSWEVKQLKWFRVADLQKECLAAKAERRQLKHMAGNRIRPFLEDAFLKEVDWTGGALALLAAGQYPFPDAPDRWKEWQENKWVSEDGTTTK